jgi:hypothetical protein
MPSVGHCWNLKANGLDLIETRTKDNVNIYHCRLCSELVPAQHLRPLGIGYLKLTLRCNLNYQLNTDFARALWNLNAS